MKTLLLGIVLLIVLGVGGFLYRNAVEHPAKPIACPMDAKVCPDGTSVARVGTSCEFPACPPPNVVIASAGIAFATPEGFVADENAVGADPNFLAAFVSPNADSPSQTITIRRFPIGTSTALAVIQATALGEASGAPLPATAFTSTTIGTHRFTVAAIGRFEGVVDTAYYLARGSDVLRFDAIDRNVMNWTDSNLDTASLPGNLATKKLLGTLQGD